MNNGVKVKFYDPDFTPDSKLIYSVIGSTYKGKWVFVRHNKRTTFEIAGGHIEEGETAMEAAKRELMEETGALKFKIECIATYSVTMNGETAFGRLYFADIEIIGDIPDKSEIGEVIISDTLPENLTHPYIQPHLFKRVQEYLGC